MLFWPFLGRFYTVATLIMFNSNLCTFTKTFPKNIQKISKKYKNITQNFKNPTPQKRKEKIEKTKN